MDKKFTPREVAEAVLAKAEKGVHQPADGGAPKYSKDFAESGISSAGAAARSVAHSKRLGVSSSANKNKAVSEHKKVLGELKAMPKPNLTKSDSTIAMAEQDQTPVDGVQKESIGQHDPAQGKENGNPPWGTEPGHYKLARFMGHRDARRKAKVPQNG